MEGLGDAAVLPDGAIKHTLLPWLTRHTCILTPTAVNYQDLSHQFSGALSHVHH